MVADLAGIVLTATELSNAVKAVPAQIVTHVQPATTDSDVHVALKKAKARCLLM